MTTFPLALADGLWLFADPGDAPSRQAVVRGVLAGLLGRSPEAVPVVHDDRGKPGLADGALSFSLARRGGLLLVGVGTAGQAVGVDLETLPCADREGVARTLFSPAEARWLADHPGGDGFARVWTAKEAVLKAAGIGIAEGMAEPVLPLPPPPGPAVVGLHGVPYRVEWYAASVADGTVLAARATSC